jgi:hypothetical protein
MHYARSELEGLNLADDPVEADDELIAWLARREERRRKPKARPQTGAIYNRDAEDAWTTSLPPYRR